MNGGKKQRLPTVDETDLPAVESPELANGAGKTPEVDANPAPELKLPTCIIEVPLAHIDPVDYQNHWRDPQIHVRPLTPEQGITYRRIWAGLKAQRARLKNDRPVESYADALRWMLEQVEAA